MNKPLMIRSRRAFAVLGTAAIVLGGAVVARSTQQTAAPADASKRESPKPTKSAPPVSILKRDDTEIGAPGLTKSTSPPSFPRADMSRGGPRLPLVSESPVLSEKVSPAVVAAASAGRGTERVEKLLDRIDRVDRKERFRRWREIFEFTEVDPTVVKKLEDVATGRSPSASRYVRFVAAANTAGFGAPNRIGPNSLRGGMPLGRYIYMQNSIRIPRENKRSLRIDPSLEDLNVVVPPNADNSLRFQEILWTILEKYRLDFRTEPDGTFMIFPEKLL